jgi:predicted phage-related endonuclease
MYVVQATVHLMCAKVDICHVPAYLGGKGAQMFHVTRNADLVNIICEKVAAFWKLVQSDIPPEGWPTLDVARMMKRQEGKRLMISAGPVQTWRELDKQAKELQAKADTAKAAVLALMGDAEIGETEGGIVKVSKSEQKRIDADALRANFPDIAKQVTKISESIRINFKVNS